MKWPEPIEHLAEGPDGGIIATWRTGILQLDRYGKLLWARKFQFRPYGMVKGIAAGPEGGVYVIGETHVPHETQYRNSIDTADEDGFVTRMDRRGVVLWSRSFFQGEKNNWGRKSLRLAPMVESSLLQARMCFDSMRPGIWSGLFV